MKICTEAVPEKSINPHAPLHVHSGCPESRTVTRGRRTGAKARQTDPEA